jgi:hypothetical protein
MSVQGSVLPKKFRVNAELGLNVVGKYALLHSPLHSASLVVGLEGFQLSWSGLNTTTTTTTDYREHIL